MVTSNGIDPLGNIVQYNGALAAEDRCGCEPKGSQSLFGPLFSSHPKEQLSEGGFEQVSFS